MSHAEAAAKAGANSALELDFPGPVEVKTATAGMVWPALPSDSGALALAMQYQLDQTQWCSTVELELRQMQQLAMLLRHAYDTVLFWRGRLAAAGYAPDREITLEWLRSMPSLTRADIQLHGEALVSRALPRDHGALSRGQTSGSTGMPVGYVTTELTRFFWRCFTLREHLWQQRDFRGKLASIRFGTEEHEGSGWGDATDVALNTGPLATLSITTDVEYQLAWLQRQNPDYLLSFPSNLDELARMSLERGIRIPRLREVRAISEALSPQTRLLVRAAWGARMTDIYSAQEVGYIALQCPQHEHYHVQAEGVIVEIIDDDGEPCKPGEVGRVVVTSLHNFAMPLIRYEIGDLAQRGAACPCGRGLPVIAKIYGRVRNMLTLPDGRRNWPTPGDIRGSASGKVRQYQLIQRSLERIDVLLVVRSELTPAEENRLRATMQKALGHAFDLRFVYGASIERSGSGKFEEFRSELYSPPAQ